MRTAPLAGAGFVAMAAGQIATPLTDHDPTLEWLSALVVVGFGVTTLALATGHWGVTPAAAGAAVVVVATALVERVGTAIGFPFGDYEYTGALEPTVAGVPVIVPVAWFAMAVPALEVARRITSSRVGAPVVGALALTAWDLFLDPQMVDAGYWEWAADGAYRGIPLSNYAGWLGVGVVVLAVLDRLRPPVGPSTWLVALYTWWAVMSTVGFVVFFGDPFVGAVGGVAMGSTAGLAWWRGADQRG